MIVVKVGGSLYDLPGLGQRLRSFLESLADPVRLVVPGGGATADAIRAFDRDHALGPVASHWLALRACSVNAHFLLTLLPGFALVADPNRMSRSGVLDPFAFAERDEGQPGRLPHTWDATSDSVAARAAIVGRGSLVLLKSVDLPPGMSWEQAADQGHVDPLTPGLIRESGLSVRVVNLRTWREQADR